MPATATATMPTLDQQHHGYFYDRAFTAQHLDQLTAWGVRSISPKDALDRGIKKWDGIARTHLSDGGIWMPFSQTYGQIRFNTPLTTAAGETFKYLSPATPAQAWVPPTVEDWAGVQAMTEGWADAAAPTIRGVPTAAIVGVYNIIYSVPKGCKVPIIFDSDGWAKPQVVRALILGSIWTNGKINLFPEMPQFPNGGGCEFFKAGYSIADYQALVDGAMKPRDFLEAWVAKWPSLPSRTRTKAVWVASECLEWLTNPNAVLAGLERQREAKATENGLSPQHVPNPDKFLDSAVEMPTND